MKKEKIMRAKTGEETISLLFSCFGPLQQQHQSLLHVKSNWRRRRVGFDAIEWNANWKCNERAAAIWWTIAIIISRWSNEDRVETEIGGIASANTIVNAMIEKDAFDLMVVIQLRWFAMPSLPEKIGFFLNIRYWLIKYSKRWCLRSFTRSVIGWLFSIGIFNRKNKF